MGIRCRRWRRTWIRSRVRGTGDQAANGVRVGATQGRTRNDREHRIRAGVKDVYRYPCRAGLSHATRKVAGIRNRRQVPEAAPVPLFDARFTTTWRTAYDVSPEGRFLIHPRSESAAPITLILNRTSK